MYHAHKAEIRHDKIYALLGMSSDYPRVLREGGLEPNYNLEWKVLMHRLTKSVLSSKASIDTWNDKEVAVIKSKGCILGRIVKVESNSDSGGNSQSIEAIFRNASPKSGTVYNWPVQSSVRWTLRASAKAIQCGDLICFLEGASEPTIVRLGMDYSTIIMIRTVLPEVIKSCDCAIQKSEVLQSTQFTRDFLLVWDWETPSEKSWDCYNIWAQTHNLESKHSNTGFESRLYRFIDRWNAVIYEDAGDWNKAEKELCGIIEDYIKEEHPCMRDEAVGELLLQVGKTEVGSSGQYGRLLYFATMNAHPTVVRLLIGTGKVDIESKDEYGQTALLWAAQKGHEAVVKQLLEAGAEIESKDECDGQTALGWAAEKGHEAVVKQLLEAGAEIESKDECDQTALLWAAAKGHEAVVKQLLEAGAEIESKDKIYGQTALGRAAQNGHEAVVKLLERTTSS